MAQRRGFMGRWQERYGNERDDPYRSYRDERDHERHARDRYRDDEEDEDARWGRDDDEGYRAPSRSGPPGASWAPHHGQHAGGAGPQTWQGPPASSYSRPYGQFGPGYSGPTQPWQGGFAPSGPGASHYGGAPYGGQTNAYQGSQFGQHGHAGFGQSGEGGYGMAAAPQQTYQPQYGLSGSPTGYAPTSPRDFAQSSQNLTRGYGAQSPGGYTQAVLGGQQPPGTYNTPTYNAPQPKQPNYGEGSHGPRTNFGGTEPHAPDSDYGRWRQEHLSTMDKQYQSWRDSHARQLDEDYARYSQFSNRFEDWRRQNQVASATQGDAQTSGAPENGRAEGGKTDKGGGGNAKH